MNLLTDLVPQWISVAFLLVIPIPVFLIARLAAQYSSISSPRSLFWGIVLFYGMYFIYVSYAAINGWFDALTLPPMILQRSTLPLLLFLLLIVFNLPAYRKTLAATPLESLVKIHIFRLIGSFFIILSFHEVLPRAFALIAGIGDVLTALSSIWIARYIRKKGRHARLATVLWNTFGFADILTTAAMAFIITKIQIETGSPGVEALAAFPFCLIPAFAPPTIIFLHLSVYRKLLAK
ncbi:MAG: hypothetical protein AAFO69_07745 [Bacteroidota bacterium]